MAQLRHVALPQLWSQMGTADIEVITPINRNGAFDLSQTSKAPLPICQRALTRYD